MQKTKGLINMWSMIYALGYGIVLPQCGFGNFHLMGSITHHCSLSCSHGRFLNWRIFVSTPKPKNKLCCVYFMRKSYFLETRRKDKEHGSIFDWECSSLIVLSALCTRCAGARESIEIPHNPSSWRHHFLTHMAAFPTIISRGSRHINMQVTVNFTSDVWGSHFF